MFDTVRRTAIAVRLTIAAHVLVITTMLSLLTSPARAQETGQRATAERPAAMPGPAPQGRAALTEGAVMFGRIMAQTYAPDVPGSGPFPAKYDVAPGTEYTVYAPMDVRAAAAKRKLPIYAWSNGGCSSDGASARFQLLEVASFGYVVITPGVPTTGPRGSLGPGKMDAGGMAPGAKVQTPDMLRKAIDWLIAENSRIGSPYFEKIDTGRIAVAGGSCGGLVAMATAFDPRIKSLTLFNSGVFNVPPAMPGMVSLQKVDLAKLHTPVLYITGGPEDVAQPNAMDDFGRITHVPVFVADRPHVGHLGMAFDPHSEGAKIEVHWLEYTLFGNKRAGLMFTGTDCSLCRDIAWTVFKKGL